MVSALFDIGEKNVLIVDYEDLVPASDYNSSVKATQHIGRVVADFLADVTLPIQLIGFSLGAHVAGVVGHILRTEYNQTLDTIIGNIRYHYH